MSSNSGGDDGAVLSREAKGARKRVAVETYVRHEATLRRMARRYSLCADDADDALQRTLEIVLEKAPSEDPRELIRWTQTVLKHEALAVRRERERILSGPAATPAEPGREDWTALLPAATDGPAELVERRETIARSREALQTLKPQELRALSLLAEGYSYLEIGEITGFSQTKVNRCLAEGRERFRRVFAASEDGGRCEELGALLSAFCDGEAGTEDAAAVREHLRACASCRATLRAYRAAPRAAALAPALPLGRSFLERVQDACAELAARFGNGGGAPDPATVSQVAAGGGIGGTGIAAIAKAVALCVGTAGGAAACVATGVLPTPLDIGSREPAPALERRIDSAPGTEPSGESRVRYEPAGGPAPDPVKAQPEPAVAKPPPAPSAAAPPASGAVEYAPPPQPEIPEPSSEGAASGGDPAGEFGP